MKILVVEDDLSVAETVQILLFSQHYAVDIAVDGETGLEMVNAFDYDLVLLDIELPGVDGMSVCQQLRARGLRMPILLLTAQERVQRKANVLNVGADDYVVKPFEAEELMARVQALLRRGDTQTQPLLTFGNLSIDPRNRSVTDGTNLLSLTPKECCILELFLRNPQQVLSVKAILDRVWHSAEAPGEAAVRGHIKSLRKKLRAVSAPKDLIKTVQGMGYQLNPVYSAALTSLPDQPLTDPQITELRAANTVLRNRVTALQSAHVELDQLRVRNEELERLVAELTAELTEANRQPQQRREEPRPEDLHQRIRGLTHDLNNIFTPILATAQLIRLTRKELDVTTQERLKDLEESTKRGASLVKAIQALALHI